MNKAIIVGEPVPVYTKAASDSDIIFTAGTNDEYHINEIEKNKKGQCFLGQD
jgi:hypothetical protein